MKKFAVGYINLYDNEMVIEIHPGETWQAAVAAHSKIGDFIERADDLGVAQERAFDQDFMFDVEEVIE